MPLILYELFSQPKSLPILSLIVVLVLTCILSYKQMWTLILSRITLRISLVIFVAVMVFILIEWALGALNIAKPDNVLAVIAGLVVGLVLSAISLVLFKVKSDTFDYVE